MVLVRHMRLRAQEKDLINDLKQRVHPWVRNFEHGGLISLTQNLAHEDNDDLPLFMEVTLQEQLLKVQVGPFDRGIISQRDCTDERAECSQVLLEHTSLLVVDRLVGHFVEFNLVNKHAFFENFYCVLNRT